MSWSYNTPPQSDVDLVRLLLQDTVPSRQLLQDEELESFLWFEGDTQPSLMQATRAVLYRAASRAARAIGNAQAMKVDVTSAEEREARSALMGHFYLMADSLNRESTVGIPPRMGGISISEKIASRQDTDLVQPFFRRSMGTFPGTGPQSAGSDDEAEEEFDA